MSSLSAIGNLTRTDAGPFRDPLVVIFHLPYGVFLGVVYGLLSSHTSVQSIYFAVAIMLYASSTAYHCWKPNDLLRKCDQTMIGLYIVGAQLPFTYATPWCIWVSIALATLIVVSSWWKRKRYFTSNSLIFLSTGVIASGAMVFAGIPYIGISYESFDALLLYSAIGCFLGKWWIYHFQRYWPCRWPHLWAAPECGHFVLSIGVGIITYLVVKYPM